MKFAFVIFLLIVELCLALPPKLIFYENFDELNLRRWTHLVTAWGGGNDEFQYYRNSRRNSFIKDGALHIRPSFTVDEFDEDFLHNGTLSQPGCNYKPCHAKGTEHDIVPPIFSARLSTQNSFAFKFGRVEVRAKMPRGNWIWPAIWLLPHSTAVYGGWPTGGEIDIAELRGNSHLVDENGNDHGVRKMGSTMHFGPNFNTNSFHLTNWEKVLEKGDFSDDFHTFALDWKNTSMTFSVDDDVVGKIVPPEGGFWELGGFKKNPGGENPWSKGGIMAPFDQKFYLILNVAVGGRYFPDRWRTNGDTHPWSWANGSPRKDFWNARKKWWPTWDRPEMIVDHVLVYGYD